MKRSNWVRYYLEQALDALGTDEPDMLLALFFIEKAREELTKA